MKNKKLKKDIERNEEEKKTTDEKTTIPEEQVTEKLDHPGQPPIIVQPDTTITDEESITQEPLFQETEQVTSQKPKTTQLPEIQPTDSVQHITTEETIQTDVEHPSGEPVAFDDHENNEDNEISESDEEAADKPETITPVSDKAHTRPADQEVHHTLVPSQEFDFGEEQKKETIAPPKMEVVTAEATNEYEKPTESTEKVNSEKDITESIIDEITEPAKSETNKSTESSEVKDTTTDEKYIHIAEPSTEKPTDDESGQSHEGITEKSSTESLIVTEKQPQEGQKEISEEGTVSTEEVKPDIDNITESQLITEKTGTANEGQDEITVQTTEGIRITEPSKEGEIQPDVGVTESHLSQENQQEITEKITTDITKGAETSREPEVEIVTAQQIPQTTSDTPKMTEAPLEEQKKPEISPSQGQETPTVPSDEEVVITNTEPEEHKIGVTPGIVTGDQEEGIEIVTSIPTRETERPQSMDHVSETTAPEVVSGEVEKEGETPDAAITEQTQVTQKVEKQTTGSGYEPPKETGGINEIASATNAPKMDEISTESSDLIEKASEEPSTEKVQEPSPVPPVLEEGSGETEPFEEHEGSGEPESHTESEKSEEVSPTEKTIKSEEKFRAPEKEPPSVTTEPSEASPKSTEVPKKEDSEPETPGIPEIMLELATESGHATIQSEKNTSEPEKVTSEPEKVTSEPEKVTLEPEKVTSEPEKVTSEPEKVTMEPEKVAEPEKVTSEPEKVTSEPEKVTSELEKTTSEPEKVTMEPEKVTTQSEQDTSEPDKVTSKPDKVTSEPEKVTSEPEKVTVEPEKVTTKPEKVAEPEIVTTEPGQVTMEPEQVTTKAEPVTSHPELVSVATQSSEKVETPKLETLEPQYPPERITTEVSSTQEHESTEHPQSVSEAGQIDETQNEIQQTTDEVELPKEPVVAGQDASATESPLHTISEGSITETTELGVNEVPRHPIQEGTQSPVDTSDFNEIVTDHIPELVTDKSIETPDQTVIPGIQIAGTIAPEIVSQEPQYPDVQEATDKSIIPDTSVISIEEEHGIPGEGSCLVDGQTYRNNSNVPPINQCQLSCKCISSILQCESVPCAAPPNNLQNCMPILQSPGSCCPTYSCSVPGVTNAMESDSHVVETTTAAQEIQKVTITSQDESATSVEGTLINGEESYRKPSQEKGYETTESAVHKVPADVIEVVTTVPAIPQEETNKSESTEKELQVPDQTTYPPKSVEKDTLPTETPTLEEHTKQEEIKPEFDESQIPEEPHIIQEHCGKEGCTPVHPLDESPVTEQVSEEIKPENDGLGNEISEESSEEPHVSSDKCTTEKCEPELPSGEPQNTTDRNVIDLGTDLTEATEFPIKENEQPGTNTTPSNEIKAQTTPSDVITEEKSSPTTQIPEIVTEEASKPEKYPGEMSTPKAEEGPAPTEYIPVQETSENFRKDQPLAPPSDTIGTVANEKEFEVQTKYPGDESTASPSDVTGTVANEVPTEEKVPFETTPASAEHPEKITTVSEKIKPQEATEHIAVTDSGHDEPEKEKDDEISSTNLPSELAEGVTKGDISVLTESIPKETAIPEHKPEEIFSEEQSTTPKTESVDVTQIVPKVTGGGSEVTNEESTENVQQTELPFQSSEKIDNQANTESSVEIATHEHEFIGSEEPIENNEITPEEKITTLAPLTDSAEHVVPSEHLPGSTHETEGTSTVEPIVYITETQEIITSKPIESAEHVTEIPVKTMGEQEPSLAENEVTEVSVSVTSEQSITDTEVHPAESEHIPESETEKAVTTLPEGHPLDYGGLTSDENIEKVTVSVDIKEQATEGDIIEAEFPIHAPVDKEIETKTPLPSEPAEEVSQEQENPEIVTKETITETQHETEEATVGPAPGDVITKAQPENLVTESGLEQVITETQPKIPEIVTETPEVEEEVDTKAQPRPEEVITAGPTESGAFITGSIPVEISTKAHSEIETLITESYPPHETVITEKQPGLETTTAKQHGSEELFTAKQPVLEAVTEEQPELVPGITEKQPTLVEETTAQGEIISGKQPDAESGPEQGVTESQPGFEEEHATKQPETDEVSTETVPGPEKVVTEKSEEVITEKQPSVGHETTESQPGLGEEITEVVSGKQPEEVHTEVNLVSEEIATEKQPGPGEITESHSDVGIVTSTPELGVVTEVRPEVEEEKVKVVPDHGTEPVPTESGENTTEGVIQKVHNKPEAEVPVVPVEEESFTSSQLTTQGPRNDSELYTSGPEQEEHSTKKSVEGELSTSVSFVPAFTPEPISTSAPAKEPEIAHEIPGEHEQVPELPDYQSPVDDYEEEDQSPLGPGTCRYGGKVFVSAQQIPRDDPCDFCFCFRSDIICLQQSCPPPIPNCHEEPIRGFCCPRYECPVGMATTLNLTTTTTTTTTTLPPHFLAHAYKGLASRAGCQIRGQAYKVGDYIKSASGPCMHCTCGADGKMKCDPKQCSPEPMLRQMIAAAASRRRR
ncbi:hypothetical protein JTB14_014377 [Gonioctena quinquepunctata]|nr:hypothetical protein JTB14_014377 [Gonioctena quinquepunctata]